MDRKELEAAEKVVQTARDIVKEIDALKAQVDYLGGVDRVRFMGFQAGFQIDVMGKFVRGITEAYKKEALAEIERLEKDLAEL